MFSFLKFKNKTKTTEPQKVTEPAPSKSLFQHLTKGLQRTRSQLTEGLARLMLGKKSIDEHLLEEIETCLLSADIGVELTQTIIQDLTEQVSRKSLSDPNLLFSHLKDQMQTLLATCEQPLTIPDTIRPFVILIVGINGSGKTTTIGKLAAQFKAQGKKVMLAAGDTFRAAAVEQLQIWGKRNDVPVIAQSTGSDSASVIYDALESAKARQMDIVIADTAGRLHTQDHLMSELKKIQRVIQKWDPDAPHETLLVLDASIGQNSLKQAQQFNEAIQLSGITMTKLDGTAKGGVILSIAKQMKLPIRYIGVGEGIEDLQIFKAKSFVDALFETHKDA